MFGQYPALLFADDALLLVEREWELQMVKEFGKVCEWRKLKLNEAKIQVFRGAQTHSVLWY